jgi:indolepyruvate ferredoxin oxidoreductase beta subunit
MEVQRALPKLSEKTRVVVNRGTIVPFSLAVAGLDYPPIDEIIERVRSITKDVFEIDGPELVTKTGLPRTLNVVMLGAVAGLDMLPFDKNLLWTAIEKKIPERFLQANRMAFDLGVHAVK